MNTKTQKLTQTIKNQTIPENPRLKTMKTITKISAGLTAVLVFFLLWHLLMPTSLGWMTFDQIFGTMGILTFSTGITIITFIYTK